MFDTKAALEEFNKLSNAAKSRLSNALKSIDNGISPNGDTIQDLSASLTDLWSAYEKAWKTAFSDMDASGRPVADAPFASYIDTIDENERKQLKAAVEPVVALLNRFVAVKSNNENCMRDLHPIQQEASALLATLQDDPASVDPDEIAFDGEVVKPKHLFLEAVSHEDMMDDRGIELSEKLEPLFSRRVVNGLIAGAYYEPRETTSSNVAASDVLVPTAKSAPVSITRTNSDSESSSEPSNAEEQRGTTTLPPSPRPIFTKKLGVKKLQSDVVGEGSATCFTFALLASWPGLSLSQVSGSTISHFNKGYKVDKSDISATAQRIVERLLKKGYLESAVRGGVERYYLSRAAVALCAKETVYNNRDKRGNSPWLIPIPEKLIAKGVKGVLSTADRIKDFNSRDIAEISRAYDFLTSYLVYLGDAGLGAYRTKIVDHLFYSTPSTALVRFDDQYFDCVLAPDGLRISAEGKNVLSNVAPNDDEDLSEVEHWFVLKDDSLVDACASPEPQDSDVEEKSVDYGEQEVDSVVDVPGLDADVPDSNADMLDTDADASGQDTGAPDSDEEKAAREFSTGCERVPSITDDMDSKEIARVLAKRKDAPQDDEARIFVRKLFDECESGSESLVLAHYFLRALSMADDRPWATSTSLQLALGCDSDLERHSYRGAELNTAFPTVESGSNALMLSAYCRAMIAPAIPYDYELHGAAESYGKNFEEVFPDFTVLRPLFGELLKIWDVSPQKGLDGQIVEMLGGKEKKEQAIAQIEAKAQQLCAIPTVKAMIMGIPEFLASSFGESSELGSLLAMVAKDERDSCPLVEDFLNRFQVDGSDADQLEAISNFIDLKWRAAVSDKRNKGMSLEYAARKHVVNELEKRLEVLKEWFTVVGSSLQEDELKRLSDLRDDILDLSEEVSISGATFSPMDSAVLGALLADIEYSLLGEPSRSLNYDQFLTSGYISIEDGLPVLNDDLSQVVYCEPWRVLLEHYLAPKHQLFQAALEVYNSGSPMFDNLGQLDAILSKLGDVEGALPPSDDDRAKARRSAEDELDKFKDMLEMAYAYNKIDEEQKERLFETARLNKDRFFELEDYATWKRFLDGLRRRVDDFALSRKTDLERRIASSRDKLQGKNSSLLEKAVDLFEDGNYAVAEEYLNRIDAGKVDLDVLSVAESGDFAEFIRDDVYKKLYEYCRKANGNRDFSKLATAYISKNAPQSWDSDYKDSGYKENALKMVANWPKRGGKSGTDGCQSIAFLLRALGISTKQVDRVSQGRFQYSAAVRPVSRGMAQYSHPIAAFGTKMAAKLDVLVLFGSMSPRDILSNVRVAGMTNMSLVIVDSPMRLEDKRALAELSHASNNHLQFIVIDQVLALFLALHEESERLPLALKCSLPFTYYQPFVRDGGPTPDEMFCGRDAELRSIMDPGGAIVVYGGRQLGKTALLQRAESLFHKPDSGAISVYVNIVNCDNEMDVAHKVAEAFKTKASVSLGKVKDIQSLESALARQIHSKHVSRVLLLLDECDNFLDAIADNRYRELQPLIDLKSETNNSFKFVLAGLHNVCRAKNAIQENGFSGQVGSPICVKPLSPQEALQLISKPLLYLGFQVDRYPHLETILTNTNYYPGIIQFFGHTLVETMKEQYGIYYRAADGQPPYPLFEEQLGEIINKNDLNNSIKEKFRLSLELDKRYFMLARCIAMLSFTAEREDDQKSLLDGFNIGAIQSCASDFDVACLKGETPSTLEILLDEMVEMGILTKLSSKAVGYKLRRHSFLNIIGPNEDAVLDDIIEANG